jgi:hypothetical protein
MDNDSKMPIRTWVHCFTAGTQTSAQGVTRDFSVKDLKQVAESYDPVIHEAPVRVGHEDSDKVPAFGWVKGFRMNGNKLYADVEFTPDMSEMLRNGNYKKVSISMYSPESGINPTPGKWSARHLAVLGATPPAVKGLEAIQFSEQDWLFDFSAEATLETFYDADLGPTLESEDSPIASLKAVLEEAKSKDSNSKKEESMTDEKNLEVNEELQEEQLEVSAEQEETDFAEKKKMPKQGEEGMEDEDEEMDDDDSMDMSSKKKKSMSMDHEEVSEDHSCAKHKSYKEDCEDCKHMEGDADQMKKGKRIKDQFYAEDHEESEEEIDSAHGEETGKTKDGVGQDRQKKGAKAKKDVQGKVEGNTVGKSKEADGYGKSATHSAYTGKEAQKHAYPKGVEVDYEEDALTDSDLYEANISEDHYESPMEMTGDTRMANVVEQVTKESQLEAMMKQIEHLTSQVKMVTEENEKLRVAAEKAVKDKRRSELQQFVSALYESGKVTDAIMSQEKLVGFCEGLDDGTLEFSEEGQTPSGVLLNLLASLPSQVQFGEMSMDSFEFEEEEDLSPHELATRLAGEEGISYVDALKRVMY